LPTTVSPVSTQPGSLCDGRAKSLIGHELSVTPAAQFAAKQSFLPCAPTVCFLLQLVLDALLMGLWRRGEPKMLLHHSDQGSQYTSKDFQRILVDRGTMKRGPICSTISSVSTIHGAGTRASATLAQWSSDCATQPKPTVRRIGESPEVELLAVWVA
jgi:hypothetical protein